MLHNLLTRFLQTIDSITQKRVYIASFMLLVLLATSALFYQHANHFSDVDYHIPATILAQSHGYDLEGYGLSFVKSDELGALSFSHYQSAIGVQGFFYAWLYQSLGLENLKPLYKLTAFFLSLFTSSWVANFSGSLYFSFGFWILPAILAFSIYIYIFGAQYRHNHRSMPML